MKMLSTTGRLSGLVAGCMLLLAAGWAVAEELEWLTNFEQAREQAAETERPILANFTGSDWCGWCIRLDREVFSKDEFKEFSAENLVLLMIDFPRQKEMPDEEREENAQLAQTYGVRGFPTILLLDAEGEVIGRTGYRRGGPVEYVEHLAELIRKDAEKDQNPAAACCPGQH